MDVRRLALAAGVGVLCALAVIALAIALPGASTGPAPTVAAASPGASSLQLERIAQRRHGMSVPGMTEKQLRNFEIATLGPEHAREHAVMRRAQRLQTRRREQLGPSQPVAKIAAAGPPEEVGQWDPSATVTFGVVAIHAAMLPTGKVMIFSYPKSPQENSTRVYLWDPKTDPDGTHMVRRDPPLWQDPKDGTFKAANIWCSGHTFTADGELVVFGGNLEFPDPNASPPTDYKGLNKVYSFDPFSETWHEQPDMAHGRWYPTAIRMADGRIPILSGWDESGLDVIDEDVEIYNPPSTIGGTGSIAKIGHTGGVGEPPTGEFYPHMFAMPSGRTLIAGPDFPNTWFMNNPTANSFTWSDAPNLDQRRLWGTMVPMPGGTNGSSKIMALGGTEESTVHSTNTTSIFDENNPGAGWQAAPSNVIGRGHANTVLLPDGSMVEVGGGFGSDASVPGYATGPLYAASAEQRQIELWDPATGQWKLGPAQAESRAYHSTALLLPDGRVMSAGDDFNGGIVSDTAEIYKPPYLFKGTRPQITGVQQNVKFNTGFAVNTPNTNITKATLMAPSAVTHAVDMNQRYIALQVTQRAGCVDLVAPPTANVAPPGWYMLFLLNNSGVPSEAKWVKLGDSGSASSCGGPPVDGAPPNVSFSSPVNNATVSGTINVDADASDNVGVAGVQFVLDGQNLGGETGGPAFARSWNTTGVADGLHELKAVARDAAGNTATATINVRVVNHPPDNTAPSVSVTSPGSNLSGTVSVGASASDNVGVTGVQFKLDGSNLGAEDAAAPWSVGWDTTDVANGTHVLTAVARDAAGNKTTSAPVSVTVANTAAAPSVWLSAPLPGARLTGRTTVTAGANAGLRTTALQILLDGKLLGQGSTVPFSLSWDTTNVANGSHHLSAVARDAEGNATASGTVAVTVANPDNTTPPPADGAPGLSKLKLSSKSFRKSTKISFRLTEAARVTLSFERKTSGRKRGGKCVPGARKGARCTTYRKLRAKVAVEGKAGVNTLRLGRRGMAAGGYRLTLIATDAGGKRSAKLRLTFKVIGSAGKASGSHSSALEAALRSARLAF